MYIREREYEQHLAKRRRRHRLYITMRKRGGSRMQGEEAGRDITAVSLCAIRIIIVTGHQGVSIDPGRQLGRGETAEARMGRRDLKSEARTFPVTTNRAQGA